jgi:DNA-directed RNA polymerase subunit K/omega
MNRLNVHSDKNAPRSSHVSHASHASHGDGDDGDDGNVGDGDDGNVGDGDDSVADDVDIDEDEDEDDDQYDDGDEDEDEDEDEDANSEDEDDGGDDRVRSPTHHRDRVPEPEYIPRIQQFKADATENYIADRHPESIAYNHEEVELMSKVTRVQGVIVDPLHRTVPHMTRFERANIIGTRTKHLDSGVEPMISVAEDVVDNSKIAEMEMAQGLLPYIIRRFLPSGASEFWRVSDLEIYLD